MIYKFLFKRVLDIFFASLALVSIFPFLLFIAYIIKKNNKGPVFFKQKRIGQHFKPFNIYKFRTMVVNADKMGALITHAQDSRITKVGAFLRRYKLDELPQLFNVIKGDMSIVGPRPEVEKYCCLFKNDYKEILLVKPGITDPATLFYSKEEEILALEPNKEDAYIKKVLPEKIKMSRGYVKDLSFFYDVKLIFKTLKKIVV